MPKEETLSGYPAAKCYEINKPLIKIFYLKIETSMTTTVNAQNVMFNLHYEYEYSLTIFFNAIFF